MCCGSKRMQLKNAQARDASAGISRSATPQRGVETVRPQIAARPGAGVHPALFRAQARAPDRRLSAAVEVAPDDSPSIDITYLENSPIRVQGLATGRSYEFSAAQRVQEVDARDASALTGTRFFRRA
jgi:hypothetical protein